MKIALIPDLKHNTELDRGREAWGRSLTQYFLCAINSRDTVIKIHIHKSIRVLAFIMISLGGHSFTLSCLSS